MPPFYFFLEIAVISQCCFSVVYLSSYHWKHNKWLVIAFLGLMLPIWGILLGTFQLGIVNNHLLDNPAFLLLVGPALYLYTARLVDISLRSRLVICLPFVPFVVYYLAMTQLGVVPSKYFLPDTQLQLGLNVSFLVTFLVVNLYYSFKTYRLVLFNERKYLDEFSEAPVYVTLVWIKGLVVVIAVIMVVVALRVALVPWLNMNVIPLWVPFSGMLLATFVLSFFAFRQPMLYTPLAYVVGEVAAVGGAGRTEVVRDEDRKEVFKLKAKSSDSEVKTDVFLVKEDQKKREPTEDLSKPKKLISEEERVVLAGRLELFMREKRPYLNPKIRMPELAGDLGVSTHVFSFLINEHYGVNFFSFINERRVKYACVLLKDADHQLYTLEAIGKMSGFNSRSTFNARFKEFMGGSPGEFRIGN